MSIGDWFKRIFSSGARTDAPLDVANATDEKTIDERRIEARGGDGPTTTANYGGLEADEAVEGELSEYEPPSE